MKTRILVNLTVALGVAGILTVGFVGTTSASQATADSVRPGTIVKSAAALPSYAQAVATVDSGTRAIGVTVPHGITAGMYDAVEGKYLESFCRSIPHPGYRWACEQVAEYAKAIFESLGAPARNECLRVEPRLGWPPIHVFYVTC